MSLFLRADRRLSAAWRRARPATICSPWCARMCAPSSDRRSSRPGKRTAKIIVAGGRTSRNGEAHAFSIAAQPVASEGEDLLLVCFVDEPRARAHDRIARSTQGDVSRVAELEQELESTRAELQGAIRDLETFRRGAAGGQRGSALGQRGIPIDERGTADVEGGIAIAQRGADRAEQPASGNAGAASAPPPTICRTCFTAPMSRRSSSTPNLNIRFFTPATKLLFNVIPSDVGRPLADLNSLAADRALLADARTVLQTSAPARARDRSP